jgi:hypothetical protein
VGMTLNNVLLLLDKLVFQDVDLMPFRLGASLAALLLLLFGLIYEKE